MSVRFKCVEMAKGKFKMKIFRQSQNVFWPITLVFQIILSIFYDPAQVRSSESWDNKYNEKGWNWFGDQISDLILPM